MTAASLPEGCATALASFRAFHGELTAVLQDIAMQDWTGMAGEGGAAGVLPEPEAAARAVFARLCRALPALAPPPMLDVRVGGRRGTPAAPADADAALPDLGYVMAAVADEALLHGTDWPGKAVWSGSLIEEGLYGTRIAGERLFEAAEALAARPLPRTMPLAAVLLTALSLGFRGRYRGRDDRGHVADLAARLHAAVFGGELPSAAGAAAVLARVPIHVMREAERRPLPALRPWLLALIGVLALYLVGSHLAWRVIVSDVIDTARAIVGFTGSHR